MERRIELNVDLSQLFGQLDENVRLIEKRYDISVLLSDGALVLCGDGDRVNAAESLFRALASLSALGEEIDRGVVLRTAGLVENGQADRIGEIYGQVAAVTAHGKKLRVKSAGQLEYVNAMKKNTIVFGIGHAGTGKTFLAVARAVAALRAGEVQKIILTRPAIEAGEKLGFLPGDLQTKVDPYLRPLYDALEELTGESYLKLIERGVAEIAPLAYMRGRTLKASFVILDEAQNTTREQMRMFLTRLGSGSRMVVNGDISQIDLPPGKQSGLVEAAEILQNVDRIAVVHLGAADVVRHELVTEIVRAYESADLERRQAEKEKEKENGSCQ
ncbi:MAG: PhoH family protein [Clostridiales bacterium]|nr:PhoH family protein [Clostridiales bacterium]